MKKILFALMCLSIFVVACEQQKAQDGFDSDFDDVSELISSGQEKMKSKDIQGAIDSFTKASEMDGSPDTLSFLALAKSTAHDYAGALTDMNKALDMKIEKRYYVQRAEIQISLGNLQEASNDIRKAISISDDGGWPYLILSKIELKMGNNQEALDSINKALSTGNSTQTDKVWYYMHRANIKYITKDNQGALDDINQALEIVKSLENAKEHFFDSEIISNFHKQKSEIEAQMGDKGVLL